MALCEVCGNDYDKSFSIEANGEKHVFDSLNERCKRWLLNAHTAIVESSVIRWKATAKCIVTRVVPSFRCFGGDGSGG